MADATGAFFDALGRRGYDPALQRASGTVAIEVAKGRARRRWLVTIDKGAVSVARTGGPADVTIRTDDDVFRSLASGRTSPMAAIVRGSVTVEGDPQLLLLFRRLLPGPPKRRRRP